MGTLLVGVTSEEPQSSSAVDVSENGTNNGHLRFLPDENCERSTYSSMLAVPNDGIFCEGISNWDKRWGDIMKHDQVRLSNSYA